MSSLVVTKSSTTGDPRIEVNVRELTLRLQSLENGCNLEIVRLAIASMLEEIKEAVGEEQKR